MKLPSQKEKLFVVVAYDVVDDRRRTRLHNKLKAFGIPVEYSVFECLLDTHSLSKMERMVKREIQEDEDQVRYYFLCEACRRKIVAINGTITEEKRAIVV